MPFSLKPDTFVKKADDTLEINKEESTPYIMLGSLTQGNIYYTAKDNKYFITEGKECPKDVFEKKFLPYLRWKFDQINSETGVNEFPPSPMNIAKKRKELIEAAMAKGKNVSQDYLYRETAPVELKNTPQIEAEFDNSASRDEKLIRRIKGNM